MKFTKITLLIALLGSLTLNIADNVGINKGTNISKSIDSQIAAIHAAPAKERVQMMNEFKQKLAKMNQQERMNTIVKMQKRLQGKVVNGLTSYQQTHDTKNKGYQMNEMMKERTQSMAKEQQMQVNEHMSHIQNMNQMQAGNNFMNMYKNENKSSMPMNNWTNGNSNGNKNFNMNMER